jgi:acyl-CoA synthetase (AMP-forming)/AMP-acid ligase II
VLLDDMLELNARRRPAHPAVVLADAGRTVTYADLAERAHRLANALCAYTEPGDRVALLGQNSAEYIECYYGVPASACALTMLNYRLHPREWAWILDDCGARVLIVDEAYADTILDLRAGGELDSIEQVVVIGAARPGTGSYEDLLSGGRTAPSSRRPAPDDTAWILYTSGTTGHPKGAMLTHENLVVAGLQSVIAYQTKPSDRTLYAMPMCHVSGYLIPVAQFHGGTVVVQGAWDPEGWMQIVAEYGITSGGFAPAMMNMLLRHPKINEYRLDSLDSMGYGAAIMPVEVLRRTIARFGPIVYAGFGMTELSGNVLHLDKEAHVRAARGEEHLLASAGLPMSMVDVRVFDDGDRECPTGVVGEIVVKGPQTTKGYFGNPVATAEAYRGGWFHTGDLARRDEEGFFYIVDRKKDMIITGGENVYSSEVENAIYAHPSVAEVAVFGVPHEKWGEAVTAAIVLRDGGTATEEDIVASCRERLAGYKRPQRVVFVDGIPKTVTGKVLKRNLRETYRALFTPSGEAAPTTSTATTGPAATAAASPSTTATAADPSTTAAASPATTATAADTATT